MIPEEGTLQMELLQAIHEDPAYVYPGRTKFRKLVKDQYYWPGLIIAVDQYQKNCHKCIQSSHPYDKTPGWLHSLAIRDWPWDNISMDFHSLNQDKYGYNYIMVVVDWLGKRSFCLPCKDTINVK